MPRFIKDSSVNLTLNPFPEHIRDNRREAAQRRRAVRIPPSRIRVNPRNPWSNIPSMRIRVHPARQHSASVFLSRKLPQINRELAFPSVAYPCGVGFQPSSPSPQQRRCEHHAAFGSGSAFRKLSLPHAKNQFTIKFTDNLR